MTASDNHVLRGIPPIGPRGAGRLGTGETREPRWDLDFERGVLCKKCIRLFM